ncbi:hypothetical protein ILUMI_22449 [Ignelater luminosus]|uniref:Uncharacterized protein n=1 Tax=Ignelater luminosus TaxID=2038154 RepID=A0A8K0CEG7_IGNLU|nr:hypothetical protein ILUMI_22449 [Ignelater luminosus]
MYRQILIRPEQGFWRERSSDEISCYDLNTVTFGTSPAPYLDIKCLARLTEEYKHKFLKACSAISNSFYIDDLLTEEFELMKYVSNNQKVLAHVSSETDYSILQLGEHESTKTLSVMGNSSSDTIQFQVNPSLENNQSVTKRTILSISSQIFDPLGVLRPMQVEKLMVLAFMQDLSNQNIFAHLVCAKSKAAPTRKITLPRLELCVAVLGPNLLNTIQSALHYLVANRVADIQSITKPIFPSKLINCNL